MIDYHIQQTPAKTNWQPENRLMAKFDAEESEKPRKSRSSISQVLRPMVDKRTRGLLASSAEGIVIRSVQNDADWDAVYRMTHDNYVELGYCRPQPDGRLVHYPEFDHLPETTVLVAEAEGRIVGTCSLTIDGPHGLPVHDDFMEECDALREEGRILADCWRFATIKSCRHGYKVAMALIADVLRRAVQSGVTTCLIAAIPRHGRMYAKLLNGSLSAYREQVGVVKGTNAVLVRCDYETLPEWCLQGCRVRRAFVEQIASWMLSQEPDLSFC